MSVGLLLVTFILHAVLLSKCATRCYDRASRWMYGGSQWLMCNARCAPERLAGGRAPLGRVISGGRGLSDMVCALGVGRSSRGPVAIWNFKPYIFRAEKALPTRANIFH